MKRAKRQRPQASLRALEQRLLKSNANVQAGYANADAAAACGQLLAQLRRLNRDRRR